MRSQYAARYEVADAAAAMEAARSQKVPGMTASTGAGTALVMSFPAESNYDARTRALAVQAAIVAAGQPVTAARIRQGHGMFAGPWFDLNEDVDRPLRS